MYIVLPNVGVAEEASSESTLARFILPYHLPIGMILNVTESCLSIFHNLASCSSFAINSP